MLTLIDSMGVQIESEFKVSYRSLNNYFLEFPGSLAVKGLALSLAQELLHAMYCSNTTTNNNNYFLLASFFPDLLKVSIWLSCVCVY